MILESDSFASPNNMRVSSPKKSESSQNASMECATLAAYISDAEIGESVRRGTPASVPSSLKMRV